jgi:hypothetical protein
MRLARCLRTPHWQPRSSAHAGRSPLPRRDTGRGATRPVVRSRTGLSGRLQAAGRCQRGPGRREIALIPAGVTRTTSAAAVLHKSPERLTHGYMAPGMSLRLADAWPPGEESFRQDRLLRHAGPHPGRVMRRLARRGKVPLRCMTRAGGVHVRFGARPSGDFVLPPPVAAQGRHRGRCAHDPAGPAGHGLGQPDLEARTAPAPSEHHDAVQRGLRAGGKDLDRHDCRTRRPGSSSFQQTTTAPADVDRRDAYPDDPRAFTHSVDAVARRAESAICAKLLPISNRCSLRSVIATCRHSIAKRSPTRSGTAICIWHKRRSAAAGRVRDLSYRGVSHDR